MSREPTTKTLTVIVVGDETAPVRRFQVDRSWFKKALLGAGAVVLALALGLADYVRLRLEAVEVERLSAETQAQSDRVETLSTSVQTLEDELARLREFERKVRVIANLPTSMAETVGGDPEAAAAHQGGGIELSDAEAMGARRAPAPAPHELLASEDPLPQNHLDLAALARVVHKAEQLGPQTSLRTASLEELVEQLDGKSKHLAATPSIWPARGWLTSRFGYRTSPFTGKRQFHGGLDIAADIGTDVVAPARGKVVFTGRKGPMGKSVVIDHGYGVRTTYGHASEIYVRLGQQVERGERIAAVGTSGRSTGPHLHYAIEVNKKAKDPLDYIFE